MQYPSANKDQVKSHRTLFISDLHLGARGCQPEAIIEFLRECRVDTIYLVGDIFDFWHVGKIHWSKVHDEIIAELNRLCISGIRIVYLVGNHDKKAREVAYKYFQKVEIEETRIDFVFFFFVGVRFGPFAHVAFERRRGREEFSEFSPAV